MTGCLRSYDDLCEALEAYEAHGDAVGWGFRFGVLYDAAERCGRPHGAQLVPWARQRVATYTNPVSFSIRA